MRKTILVTELPEGCTECSFCRSDGDLCFLLNEDIPERTYIAADRLEDCPLRELPGQRAEQ